MFVHRFSTAPDWENALHGRCRQRTWLICVNGRSCSPWGGGQDKAGEWSDKQFGDRTCAFPGDERGCTRAGCNAGIQQTMTRNTSEPFKFGDWFGSTLFLRQSDRSFLLPPYCLPQPIQSSRFSLSWQLSLQETAVTPASFFPACISFWSKERQSNWTKMIEIKCDGKKMKFAGTKWNYQRCLVHLYNRQSIR